MKIIRGYISRQVLFATVVTAAAVMAIQVTMYFITKLSMLGQGHYSWGLALYCVILKLPYNLCQMFPIIGFIGGMCGLGRLAKNNELTVIRSVGVSKLQLLTSLLLLSFFMITFVYVLGEVFGTKLLLLSEQLEYNALHASSIHSQKNKFDVNLKHVWVKTNDFYINIDKVISNKQIDGVRIFQINSNNQMQTFSYAKHGVLKGNKWQLNDVTTWFLDGNQLQKKITKNEEAPLNFDVKQQEKLIKVQSNKNYVQSLISIFKSIQYLHYIGGDANQYQYEFWHRILQPFTAMLMICLGLPFVFGNFRRIALGQRLLIGILIGFVFYMINNFMGEFSLIVSIPPILAAFIPVFIFLSLYIVVIKKMER